MLQHLPDLSIVAGRGEPQSCLQNRNSRWEITLTPGNISLAKDLAVLCPFALHRDAVSVCLCPRPAGRLPPSLGPAPLLFLQRSGSGFKTDQGLLSARRLGQSYVHAARAKTGQIKRDIGIAQHFKVCDQFTAKRLLGQTEHIVGHDFDACEVVVVTDAKHCNSLVTQKLLGTLDRGQFVDRDQLTVGKA